MHCDVAVFEICMKMLGLYPHEYVQLVGIQTSPTHINIYINLGSVKSNPKYLSLNTPNSTNIAANVSVNFFYCHDKCYPSEYTAFLVIHPAAYHYESLYIILIEFLPSTDKILVIKLPQSDWSHG